MIMNLIEIIKQAAVEAVEASKPAVPIEGEVVSESPLKIRVSQMQTLDSDFFVLTEAVKKHTAEVTVDWQTDSGARISGDKKLTVHGLKKGDKVVLLRAAGGQKFYVLGVI